MIINPYLTHSDLILSLIALLYIVFLFTNCRVRQAQLSIRDLCKQLAEMKVVTTLHYKSLHNLQVDIRKCGSFLSAYTIMQAIYVATATATHSWQFRYCRCWQLASRGRAAVSSLRGPNLQVLSVPILFFTFKKTLLLSVSTL